MIHFFYISEVTSSTQNQGVGFHLTSAASYRQKQQHRIRMTPKATNSMAAKNWPEGFEKYVAKRGEKFFISMQMYSGQTQIKYRN